jgi:hypothetical protein
MFGRKAMTACFVTAALLGSSGPGAKIQASGYHCRCHPSCEVFSSPFFGYNPTCWRAWPPGQPPCPPNLSEPAGKEEPMPKGRSLKEEMLPKPTEEKKAAPKRSDK